MYLSATMTIDPSQLTQLRRKPTKGFRRFAELLTGNLISKREEHETFTALSIMQEINVVLRSVGVTDVVKFTKDADVLYEDSNSSSSDDMPQMIEVLSRQRPAAGDTFSNLSLLLEHHLATIALIIEIRITRVHEIGVYPIQISINGLDAEMQSASDQKTLNSQLDAVFSSQQTYDAYADRKKAELDEFVTRLEAAFRGRMQVDNLHQRVYTNVVRPGLNSNNLTGSIANSPSTEVDSTSAAHAPMLQRYQSGSDSLMYLWMWSSFMHSNSIHCHDTTIVSESGVPAFHVGQEGFNAGECATLDTEAPFELPDCPVDAVTPEVGGDASDWGDMGLLQTDDGTRSSWFDSFAFSGDSSSDHSGCSGHDAGGSSCSGGSSCGGGGCGGGCGS